MKREARRICYLSGTRADFGLMQATLQAIAARDELRLDVVATGTHLSPRYAMTVREIEAAGLRISARIGLDTSESSGASMARNVARAVEGMVTALQADRPDVLLLLGDRGEMLAGAIAALHLNVPIVHVHGGERSGTVDEPLRHAISKLSHYHFVATVQSRDRLVAMGESVEAVFVTGAPGLDGLRELAQKPRTALCAQLGLDPRRATALFIYHPVVQEAAAGGAQVHSLVEACRSEGLQIVALTPNSDAGSDEIRAVLAGFADDPAIRVLTHMPRPDYVSWMACSDVMVGNSSSGIIEAASFGTPVLNIGTRQHLRERNANVTDVPVVDDGFGAILRECLRHGRFAPANVYGDGHACDRIAGLLASIDLSSVILSKSNAY